MPNPLVVFIKKIVIIRTNIGLLRPIFLQKYLRCVYLRKLFTFKVFSLQVDKYYDCVRKFYFILYKK